MVYEKIEFSKGINLFIFHLIQLYNFTKVIFITCILELPVF